MKIIFNTIILYILFTVNALAMTEKEFFKDEQYINKIIDYAILTEKLDGARGCINESLQLLNEANKGNRHYIQTRQRQHSTTISKRSIYRALRLYKPVKYIRGTR